MGHTHMARRDTRCTHTHAQLAHALRIHAVLTRRAHSSHTTHPRYQLHTQGACADHACTLQYPTHPLHTQAHQPHTLAVQMHLTQMSTRTHSAQPHTCTYTCPPAYTETAGAHRPAACGHGPAAQRPRARSRAHLPGRPRARRPPASQRAPQSPR